MRLSFCLVWQFAAHFNRIVAETLSLLVDRYYTIVVFRHWVLSSFNFKLAVRFKECYSGEDKNGALFLQNRDPKVGRHVLKGSVKCGFPKKGTYSIDE